MKRDILEQRELLKAKKFRVDMMKVRTSRGVEYEREVVVHGGAVVVLPIHIDGRVVMIRNYRFPVKETLWELCAGTIEINEDPAVCAYRELIEETGYEADRVEKLTEFYSAPGFCSEMLYVYLADGLQHVGQALEDTEEIEVALKSWDEIDQMLRGDEIRDAKTMAALLYYMKYRA